VNAQFNSLVRF